MASEQKKIGKKGLKAWLDGDMLLNVLLQRHLGLILLIFALIIAYVSNRYAFQREQVEIQHLRSELNDIKYEALARSGELMEKSRESKIQTFIVEQGSELQLSAKAPIRIKK
jgi:hypothetical protein